MRYFLISNLLILLISCSAVPATRSRDCQPVQTALWTEELRSEIALNTYQVEIRVKEQRITGICLLKKTTDGWKGTLVNEFGAKAFDFTISSNKCKLLNIIPMMDKWYIRQTLASDLYVLFQLDQPDAPFQKKVYRCLHGDTYHAQWKKKQITRHSDGSIEFKNQKYAIEYKFRKLAE